jgi:hypothetical protein
MTASHAPTRALVQLLYAGMHSADGVAQPTTWLPCHTRVCAGTYTQVAVVGLQ